MKVRMTPLRDMGYASGYCLMRRAGTGLIEVWHYNSDQFKCAHPTWRDAYYWAFAHSTLPRVPRKKWPSEFLGDDAPISWTDWPEMSKGWRNAN